VAESHATLAEVLLARGAHSEAAREARQALALYEASMGAEHPDVGATLEVLARILWSEGRRRLAVDAALRAEHIERQHVRLTTQVLSQRGAQRYSAKRSAGLNLLLRAASDSAVNGQRGAIFDALIRARGLVLDEMVNRHQMSRLSSDPTVAQGVQDVIQARRRLAGLQVRGTEGESLEDYSRRLEKAQKDRDDAETALAMKSAQFMGQRNADPGLAETAAALPAGSVLVSYAAYFSTDLSAKDSSAAGYVAFVLRAGESTPKVFSVGRAEAVVRAVSDWRREITARSPDEKRYRERGAALRHLLWDPLSASVSDANRIFIVPDGALNIVNPATLPSDAGGYLADTLSIHLLSAERDLVRRSLAPRANAGLLAMGGPDYGMLQPVDNTTEGSDATECASFDRMQFAALPHSEREVKEIADLWRHRQQAPVRIEIRGSASEAVFREHAAGQLILHLATHGFFLDRSCIMRPRGVDEGVVQAEAGQEVIRSVRIGGENPLFLAGLALAGANRRREAHSGDDDGILTADEVATLDLSDTQWVVLSACDTGLGESAVWEGVFGLRRAFQMAGARTVVMSLWQVEEDATRRWMRSLYRGRLEGQSTMDAVSHADREVLAARRQSGESTHPVYWGGFVAVGDWR